MKNFKKSLIECLLATTIFITFITIIDVTAFSLLYYVNVWLFNMLAEYPINITKFILASIVIIIADIVFGYTSIQFHAKEFHNYKNIINDKYV